MSGSPVIPEHVAKTDLESVVARVLSQLNSAPSDSPEAFLESALMWVSRWVAQHGEEAVKSLAPFAIVYEPALGDAGGWVKDGSGWADEPLFREDLPIDVGGKMCATTTSMLNVTGKSTVSKTLGDLGKELTAAGLDSQPMVIVQPANGQAICCAEGLKGQRASVSFDMAPLIDLTEKLIDEELEKFHAEHTKFPDGLAHVFHDRKQRVLFSGAESIVRDNLYQHLKYRAFRSKWIVREETTPAGRSDLAIYNKDNEHRLACVIELKVLRSRGMSKKAGAGTRDYDDKTMFRHVRMGIRQAQKYRHIASPPAKWAYVCAFDGRDLDLDLPDVEELAKSRNVLYRRYFMEVSARDDLEI